MSTLGFLPNDILVRIFKNLPDEDILTCIMVCKTWEGAGYIAINDKTISIFSEDNLKELLRLKTDFTDYVTGVELNLNWQMNTAFLLEALQVKLRNLERLTMKEECEEKVYVWLMYQYLKKPLLWQLKYISPPISSKYIEFYNACVLNYTNCLTSLEVVDRKYDGDSEVIYEQEFNRLAKQVGQFKKLEEIIIVKQGTGLSIVAFDDLIKPTLKKLTVKLFNTSFVQQITTAVNTSSSTPLPLLKTIHLSLIPTDDNSFLYIMQRFPKPSNFLLDLNSQKYLFATSLDTYCANYTAPVVARFLEYCFKIPKHHLIKLYIRNLIDVLEHLPSYMFITLQLEYSERNIRESFAEANVTLNFDKNDTTEIQKNSYFQLKLNILSHVLHSKIIESYGKHVKRLCIDGIPILGDIVGGRYLNEILGHCVQLKTLWLTNHKIRQFESTMTKNNSIIQLVLKNMEIFKEIYTELSTRLPNLRLLNILNCHYIKLNGNRTNTRQVLIDMPYSSLELLRIVYQNLTSEIELPTQTVLLKVSTLVGEQYFCLPVNNGQKGEITCLPLNMNAYQSILTDGRCINYIVQVRSLQKFTFMYHGFSTDQHCTITLQ
ncbi:hypothetical protein BD770DRAFT_210012 [Pilaira anomala]|nr:hypothetical protein BD770DRAFT_210012 [Pilaira anomala]